MKKTLITLAALALATVAQATELDFATAKDGDSVTFAGTADDEIVLVGTTTLDGNTMSYGTVDVTVNGPLFHVHNNSSVTETGTLKNATIDFGTNGQLTVKNANISFGVGTSAQNLTFTIELPELFIETTDASKDGDKVYTSRNILLITSGADLWNWERVTYNVVAADGTTTTYSGQSSNPGYGVWDGYDGMNEAGDYTLYNDENSNGERYIDIRYVSQYKYVDPSAPAVPEPATATLSLLALAGLAARRRRK